jgi:hypothetical protein
VTQATWSEDDLERIDRHDKVRIASLRPDGTLSSSQIIWAVSLNGRLYVRSVNGPGAAWYLATRQRHEGRLTARGIIEDVAMLDLDHTSSLEDLIDDAYRIKYARYRGPVAFHTAEQARATTLELLPR